MKLSEFHMLRCAQCPQTGNMHTSSSSANKGKNWEADEWSMLSMVTYKTICMTEWLQAQPELISIKPSWPYMSRTSPIRKQGTKRSDRKKWLKKENIQGVVSESEAGCTSKSQDWFVSGLWMAKRLGVALKLHFQKTYYTVYRSGGRRRGKNSDHISSPSQTCFFKCVVVHACNSSTESWGSRIAISVTTWAAQGLLLSQQGDSDSDDILHEGEDTGHSWSRKVTNYVCWWHCLSKSPYAGDIVTLISLMFPVGINIRPPNPFLYQAVI